MTDLEIKDLIKKTIEQHIILYNKKLGVYPFNINDGYCDEFAESVVRSIDIGTEKHNKIFTLEFFNLVNTGDYDWTDFYEPAIDTFNLTETMGYSKEEFLDILHEFADQTHAWIACKIDGKFLHFDAEEPNGVDNPFKLPTYKKFLDAGKQNLDKKNIENFLKNYKKENIENSKKRYNLK